MTGRPVERGSIVRTTDSDSLRFPHFSRLILECSKPGICRKRLATHGLQTNEFDIRRKRIDQAITLEAKFSDPLVSDLREHTEMTMLPADNSPDHSTKEKSDTQPACSFEPVMSAPQSDPETAKAPETLIGLVRDRYELRKELGDGALRYCQISCSGVSVKRRPAGFRPRTSCPPEAA